MSVPTFTAPLDCTPWVIGGLWPTDLPSTSPETATLAQYLKLDLQRIASSANEDLRAIGRAGMAYPARRAAEARAIDDARALAVRRVESTMRQLRQMGQHTGPGFAADMDKTQVLPAVRDEPARPDMDKTQVLPAVRDEPAPADMEQTQVLPAVRDEPPPVPVEADRDNEGLDDDDHDHDHGDGRLQGLLAFVARQEPRLNWAVGDRSDGTTVLVTDLAHGWIPPGIEIPDGVQLLEPDRRTGRLTELLDATTDAATYAPGESATWSADVPGFEASVQPRELPAVDDLTWKLRVATHWRDGLPRLVSTLTKAAVDGAEISEQEVDLLRVHLDTARFQILAQYPDVDAVQLLNCMLLAATEGSITGDPISANYHFAWFQKLAGERVETGAQSTS